MIENGFYKVKREFIELINSLGGVYTDTKSRPIFCCFEDKEIKNLFWAIPTSDYSHRSPKQKAKIDRYCNLEKRDIRYSYYHVAYTNRKAIYRISNCFPVTDKYIEGPYTSQGRHLTLGSQKNIAIIRSKLSRILLREKHYPNNWEQHITSIKNFLIEK